MLFTIILLMLNSDYETVCLPWAPSSWPSSSSWTWQLSWPSLQGSSGILRNSALTFLFRREFLWEEYTCNFSFEYHKRKKSSVVHTPRWRCPADTPGWLERAPTISDQTIGQATPKPCWPAVQQLCPAARSPSSFCPAAAVIKSKS